MLFFLMPTMPFKILYAEMFLFLSISYICSEYILKENNFYEMIILVALVTLLRVTFLTAIISNGMIIVTVGMFKNKKIYKHEIEDIKLSKKRKNKYNTISIKTKNDTIEFKVYFTKMFIKKLEQKIEHVKVIYENDNHITPAPNSR